MKDRLIVVPTSKETEQRLDYDKCTDNDLTPLAQNSPTSKIVG
jgi:hypothetical protein